MMEKILLRFHSFMSLSFFGRCFPLVCQLSHSSHEIKYFQNKFSQARVCFCTVYIQKKHFNEKMSNLAGLNKTIFNFSQNKVPIMAILDYLSPTSNSIFSTYRQNFKNPWSVLLGKVVRNILVHFERSIFKKVQEWVGSRFGSRQFPKIVISASCKLVGRPFVACYSCSIVVLQFFAETFFIASKLVDLILLFVNQLAKNSDFWRIQSIFWGFLAISSLVLWNQLIYSTHFLRDIYPFNYLPLKTMPIFFVPLLGWKIF